MRKIVLALLVIFVIAGLIGALVAASGIMPIGASSGHWPVTSKLLSFSMHRSVSFHARNIEEPDLSDPAQILRGAGHYESGCAWCHGSPLNPSPAIADAMTPPAPGLSDAADEWKPRELFYIVRHGVKFTGMPGWPVPEREDEVWSIVAFLLALPELDAAGYEELVQGNSLEASLTPEAPVDLISTCARCHGVDGAGRGNAAFPKLAGQNAGYMINALEAYASGKRHSGIMQPFAARLSGSAITELANYYAGQSAESGDEEIDEASIERGRTIALNSLGGEDPCTECHHADTKDEYPILAGQYPRYLVEQLRLFAEERRGGSEHAHLMHPIAPKLSAQDREDVAAYFASQRAFRWY